MKGLIATLALATVLVGCGPKPEQVAKPSATELKSYKPETGKLSKLQPGGGPKKKGVGTGSQD